MQFWRALPGSTILARHCHDAAAGRACDKAGLPARLSGPGQVLRPYQASRRAAGSDYPRLDLLEKF
jgi:hypothetical protein